MTEKLAPRERGMFSYFFILLGGGCLVFALLGAINTAVGGKWVLRISGARVDLPTNYEVVAGLVATGVLIIGLMYFGGFVADKFRAAKGKPLLRVGIIAGALAFLVVAGRGLQVAALVNTYGSMLAYYATDGDLDDVRAELAKKPDTSALDEAVSRAAQYDNHEALKLILAAGGTFEQSSRNPDHRYCALSRVGPKFIEIAVSHGVTPANCPNSEALIWSVVRSGKRDKATARSIELLRKAGWSTEPTPEHTKRTAMDLAEKKKWKATMAALETDV